MKKILSVGVLCVLLIMLFDGCSQGNQAQKTETTTPPAVESPFQNETTKPDENTKSEETTNSDETTKPAETTDTTDTDSPPSLTLPPKAQTLEQAATATITALKNKDMKKLATISGPDGVRFSPYSNINIDKDVVMTPEMIENAYALNRTFVWGSYDGSGEPIDLPFGQYYDMFVYDKDFMNAPDVKYNEIIGQGNTINNLNEAYPDAEFAEYHFPGFNKKYEGMDWESLRLVFEKNSGLYRLVGIVHDAWTI